MPTFSTWTTSLSACLYAPFAAFSSQEIVMYAYFKRLDYFSTECLYAPLAARGFARDFVKDLEVGPGARRFDYGVLSKVGHFKGPVPEAAWPRGGGKECARLEKTGMEVCIAVAAV